MEAIVAVLLFLFGATFLYQSYKLGFRWAVEGPQSGFFPFYVALHHLRRRASSCS